MYHKAFAIPFIVISCSLGGLGLQAFATDSSQILAAAASASDTLDLALNDRVETLLRSDVGLTGSQLRVQSRGGIVTVAGTVPDEHALRRALDLASSVRGAREIRNSMEIDFPK